MKIRGLDKAIEQFEEMSGRAAKEQFQRFLEKSGFDLLDVIQNQIIKKGIVDTRRLLNSFDVGGNGNIFTFKNGGLTLVVGTNVKYARYVNDGHFTTKKGVESRWVPGKWQGDSFEYQKGADTGMLLKRKWVDGQPYWDDAIVIYEQMFGRDLQKLIDNWISGL